MHKLLVICGPTATGKTQLAAELAKEFNGELISADSRQVYRDMDLTTGKDRPDVPIWLYDVVDPDQEFSVSQWMMLAKHAVADITARGKLPIVVGGTGLYIQALLYPPETIDIPPDKNLREQLQHASVQDLQSFVSAETLSAMNTSDRNNPRRLIRKIEIERSPINPKNRASDYNVFSIGLTAPFHILDVRIDERMEARKKGGMQEEITKLTKTYDPHLPSMSAIGVNEHAYARRQMTWFKKQPNIHWIDISRENIRARATSLVRSWYT